MAASRWSAESLCYYSVDGRPADLNYIARSLAHEVAIVAVRRATGMTVRQVTWFLAAYLAVVTAGIWFDLAILCQGDAKFDSGCGGFQLYIPLWLIFLTPLPLAAVLLEFWRRSTPPPASRLLVYLTGILIVAQVGFLLIEKFPLLLAVEAVAIAVAALLRWRVVRKAYSGAPVANEK